MPFDSESTADRESTSHRGIIAILSRLIAVMKPLQMSSGLFAIDDQREDAQLGVLSET